MASKLNFEALAEARAKLREGRAEEAAATTKALMQPVLNASPRVRLDELVENPYNSRTVYLSSQIEDKVRSLLQSGQVTPILVAQLADGQKVVVDGWMRTIASRQIVADKTLPEETRTRFSTIEAVVREDLTLQQIAMISAADRLAA